MSQANKRKWKSYPGMEGGPLHIVLLTMDAIDRMPPILLGILLAAAGVAAGGLLFKLGAPPATARLCSLTLFAGYAGDWVLLAALPRAKRSFGPVQPPLVALAGLRALVNLALGLTPLAGLPEAWAWGLMAVAQATGSILAVYSLWFEPQALSLTRHTLASPKIAASGRSLRLLHLADIHMERITERDREVIRQSQALQPDLIVFTGDFLNLSRIYDPVAWDEVRTMLAELKAPLGVYVVSGTPAVDKPEVLAKLVEGLDLRWLRDECVTLSIDGWQLDLIGLNCTHMPDVDAPRLERVLNGSDPRHFRLLLYHSPDLAPDAAQLGIDLQLSGHTHGGQVRLPLYGALIASSLYGKRFEMGRRQVDGLTLYVSRGIGMEGKGAPRVRFLCPPELALFEIRGK